MNAEARVRQALAGAKARSLIVTFMGDVVSVQPQRIWLGSLIAALGALGLSEHLVRTTCNRLVGEGWLESRRRGRRSYCGFSTYGARQYERAAARIYAGDKPPWDGHWTLIPGGGLPRSERRQLAEQLGWLGFGQLAGDLFIRAGFNEDQDAALRELDVDAPVFRAEGRALPGTLSALCRTAWPVERLDRSYRSFMGWFGPLAEGREPGPLDAFRLRFALIHAYRRIVLTDPDLPPDLLPQGWRGDAARQLARVLYPQWIEPSEVWLATVLEPEAGPWPVCAAPLKARFRAVSWRRRLMALA